MCFFVKKIRFFFFNYSNILEEFCYFFTESILDPEYNKKLKTLFKLYETDKSGNISMEEMKLLVQDINRDPEFSIDHFDADGDGVFNYQGELWNYH